MTINTFNTANLKLVRIAMKKALADTGIDGVEFEIGNLTYSETSANIKVIAKTSGDADKTAKNLDLFVDLHKIASEEA